MSNAPQLADMTDQGQHRRVRMQNNPTLVQKPRMGRLATPGVGYFLPPPPSLPVRKGRRGDGQRNLQSTTPTKAPRNKASDPGYLEHPTHFSSPLRRELQLDSDDLPPDTQESARLYTIMKPFPRSPQKVMHHEQAVHSAVQQDSSNKNNFGNSPGLSDEQGSTSSSSENDDSDDEDYQP